MGLLLLALVYNSQQPSGSTTHVACTAPGPNSTGDSVLNQSVQLKPDFTDTQSGGMRASFQTPGAVMQINRSPVQPGEIPPLPRK